MKSPHAFVRNGSREERLSIRDLRTFLAIAEGGSFAAAARAVRRTQSAVTVQMRGLEEELGTTLFDRTRRPPLLNEAGRSLVARASEIVGAYDRLFAAGERRDVEGHLRLGVVPSVITGIMPRALVALRARHPGLHVELAMGLSRDLVDRVRRGGLDAAVVSDLAEAGPDLAWAPFAREPLVLVAPPGTRARRAEDVVGALPFIRYTRQAWVGQRIDRFLRARDLAVREIMTLDTLEAITAMVHHGLGVSVVPLRASVDPLALPVRTLRFAPPAEHREVGLVHVASHAKAALADVLAAVLREAAEAGGPAVPRRPARPPR